MSRWADGSKLHVAHEIGRIVHAIQVDITFLKGPPKSTSRQQVPVLCTAGYEHGHGDVLRVQSTLVGLINQSNQPLCVCIYPYLSHVFKQSPTFVTFDGQISIMLQLVRLSLNSCLTIVFWSLKSPILCAWWLAQGFPPMACYRCSSYVPSGKHAQSYCKWPLK